MVNGGISMKGSGTSPYLETRKGRISQARRCLTGGVVVVVAATVTLTAGCSQRSSACAGYLSSIQMTYAMAQVDYDNGILTPEAQQEKVDQFTETMDMIGQECDADVLEEVMPTALRMGSLSRAVGIAPPSLS
jgi:hypothetical protein